MLELEIPQGWVASSQRGIRRGPIPAEDPSLSLWEIDGEAGRFDIELRDAADRGRIDEGSGGWISGATEVDLRRVADVGAASPSWMVNWTAECRLELDTRHPGRLEAELDPGLELIDVQGDAVRGYQTERPGDATRVVVALVEGGPVRPAAIPRQCTGALRRRLVDPRDPPQERHLDRRPDDRRAR